MKIKIFFIHVIIIIPPHFIVSKKRWHHGHPATSDGVRGPLWKFSITAYSSQKHAHHRLKYKVNAFVCTYYVRRHKVNKTSVNNRTCNTKIYTYAVFMESSATTKWAPMRSIDIPIDTDVCNIVVHRYSVNSYTKFERQN